MASPYSSNMSPSSRSIRGGSGGEVNVENRDLTGEGDRHLCSEWHGVNASLWPPLSAAATDMRWIASSTTFACLSSSLMLAAEGGVRGAGEPALSNADNKGSIEDELELVLLIRGDELELGLKYSHWSVELMDMVNSPSRSATNARPAHPGSLGGVKQQRERNIYEECGDSL